LDDLFGDEKPEPKKPEPKPAPKKPESDDLDDLFKEEEKPQPKKPAAEPEPEAESAKPADEDDAKPDEAADDKAKLEPKDDLDDLFSEPAEKPAADKTAVRDELDELLGDPAEKPAAEPVQSTKEESAPTDDPFADPFKTSAIRQWVDDTGNFRITGQLVAVLEGKVRILKSTGKTTTVSMERLSQADREYVTQTLAKIGAAGDVAAR